jgi:hypothetical protein
MYSKPTLKPLHLTPHKLLKRNNTQMSDVNSSTSVASGQITDVVAENDSHSTWEVSDHNHCR